jgi:RecB family exonuclease
MATQAIEENSQRGAESANRSRGPKRRLKPLSPSALRAFGECPKRFHYSYVAKTEVADVPSPILVMGNALHRALAFFYRLPLDQRQGEFLDRALRHFWARERGRQEAFVSDEEEASWGHRALEALAWYSRSYELAIKPLAVEEWLQTELPGGAFVGGKVDRVDERANGLGLEVIDYKGGRARLEDDDLPYDPGAQVYALVASRVYGQPVTRVRFIYLTERVERRWEIESEDLKATTERVEAAVGAVQAETEFAAQPDDHCRWCAYRQICPDRDRTSLEQLDPEVVTPF